MVIFESPNIIFHKERSDTKDRIEQRLNHNQIYSITIAQIQKSYYQSTTTITAATIAQFLSVTMVRAANERSNAFRLSIAISIVLGIFLVYSGFGVLAFVLAVFVAIFGFGLRDKFSNETTASAYSVFNRDGRAIVGGFTAGQFEQQLRGATLNNGMQNSNDDPVKGSIAQARVVKSSATKLTEEERKIRRRDAAVAAERRLRANATKEE